MNTLSLDKLESGEHLEMTYTANTALGTNGTVEIYGNLFTGRIVVNTGANSSGNTPCRINFPEGNGLGTDNADVRLRSSDGKFFNVCDAGTDATGFDIYSKELWEDNTSYEFRYTITAHIQ